MAATLASILVRVRALLMDDGSQIWTDAALTEGVRLALGEYSLAAEAPATLSGLDGAAVTSIPAEHESGLVWGSAAYAALGRAVDRAESFTLGSDAEDLKAWGDTRLREYKAMLGAIFPGYLVVLAGQAGSTGEDPAKIAAEVALLTAQADAASGAEARAEAAALQADADRAAEAARLAELRAAAGSPWGKWEDTAGIEYGEGWDRS